MKVLKLTAHQEIRLKDAYTNQSKALNEIKQNKLEGKALDAMKELEASVQHMEAFLLLVRN